MSCIDTLKISNKNAMKKTIEYKNRQKRSKNKIIFNTMIDLDKFRNKKISKSKSSSIIITKTKISEKKKKHIFIPINLGAPLIKTYNTKKKIEYNKSASDIININNPFKGLSNKNNNNNLDYDYCYKNKKNSQHNTINYVINNFNLSLKRKDSNCAHKTKEFKGINRSLMSANKNNLGFKTNNSINSNKYEELKKENENLILIYNEKIKENKKHKNKINYLENKNTHILKKVEKIKKENEKYSKILEKVLKLLQILKNNGLNVEEILENLSETDDEFDNNSNSDENENENEDNSSFNSKKSSENNFAINSEFSNFKSEGESIPSNNAKIHKINNGSNINLKDKNIPKLDMKKIYDNDNVTINGKKFGKNKHKNYSNSVIK